MSTDVPERRAATRSAMTRMLSPTLRHVLYARGLRDDIDQTIRIVLWLHRDDPVGVGADRAYMNHLQRELYALLSAYGFRRGKHSRSYDDPVLPFTVAQHVAGFDPEEYA